jgi:hypothetical protein
MSALTTPTWSNTREKKRKGDKNMLKQRAQTIKTRLEHHKELRLHMCKLPWAKAHPPPEQVQQCNMRMQQRAKICLLCPGRLDCLYRAVRPPAPHLTAWGRLDRPMWPALHQTAQNLPEPIGTPYKHSQVPKACTNFSPLLTMHESRKNAKLYNI